MIKKRLYLFFMMFFLKKQDLPIHCLKSDIVGTWTFEITELKTAELVTDNSCGHVGNLFLNL